jgi:1-acyl-sn-glycerol-3-phosphate acyltransferase
LALHNKLRIEQSSLELLRRLPKGMGIILTPNHADETDFKLCLELARLWGRQFLFMMNSEAFAEGLGTAGWWLQRLGAFSVERGGDNTEAKRYAVDAVKQGHDVLVVFPEGEIYYLNDLVQPFKSGAVDIGMKAVVEMQTSRPDWTVFMVPVAIKYRYRNPIHLILERHIRQMERHLSRQSRRSQMQTRLALILAELLHRQEVLHHLKAGDARLTELNDRVRHVREAILSQLEEKYPDRGGTTPMKTMDGTWRLSSYLRNLLRQARKMTSQSRKDLHDDLATLKRLSHMGGWQPDYVDLDPSQERMAEMVLKLEREVYQVKRVHQLARRDVFIRIGEPINLRDFVSAYLQDAQDIRQGIAERLRDVIQALIDAIPADGVDSRDPGGKLDDMS